MSRGINLTPGLRRGKPVFARLPVLPVLSDDGVVPISWTSRVLRPITRKEGGGTVFGLRGMFSC